MKFLLFCQNPYSFGILKPLNDEMLVRGDDILWYVPERLIDIFPYLQDTVYTSSIKEIYDFRADAIFVPGNEVPHYLRGVKVQVFHGFAGEKKGHFRIRHYFDLYLTQGPWFTERFKLLADKNKDFEVAETGWSKLDPLYRNYTGESTLRKEVLEQSDKKNLILYAPTFSPSLTSAEILFAQIIELAESDEHHIVIKFHDLMAPKIIARYNEAASGYNNLEIARDSNILQWLQAADIMISDTSSAVYEFLLLNKPLVTFHSRSANIKWEDVTDPAQIIPAVMDNLINDPFKDDREWILRNYHPYSDGKSSIRMIEEVEDYISRKGVPTERNLPYLRRRKMNKMFGKKDQYV